MVGIKFQPVSLRQTRRIENATPIFKAPGARADAYLLLISQIQNEIERLASLTALEKGSLPEMCECFSRGLGVRRNLTGRISQLPCHTHAIYHSRSPGFRGCRIPFASVQ